MERYYTISTAAFLLGVCKKTIRRWDFNGKLECKRTPGGHRRISNLEIGRILRGETPASNVPVRDRIAIYGRVSSHEQKKKGDLDRQVDHARGYCSSTYNGYGYIFHDIGSGLNTRRPGLQKLFKLIEKKRIDKVILTYPDRLTRFGFDYLEAYFNSHGTEIIVVNKKADMSMQEELVQDLIAIITSFSGRVHGLRSHQKKTKSLKVT